MAVNVSLTSEEKVSFAFAPTTPAGQPGLIDGSISAVVESGDATVTMNADGLTGFIVSGAAGDSVVRFSADADTTAGVKTIEEVATVTVTDPLVTTLGLSFGTPEPK